MADDRLPVVVLGAGPAGLGAAWRLARRGGFDVAVLERADRAGGNAGSFELEGLCVDYGSHRLHPACSPQIMADIRAMLGADLLDRPRHGRIHLRGRWLHFPLKPVDLALHLPSSFMLGVLRDAAVKPFRGNGASSFAAVLEHGLGSTICRDFYFPYARKIWGVDPQRLDAEQARRRVAAGSMTKMIGKVLRAVPGIKRRGGRFFYPKQGFGQISDAYYKAAVAAGARVEFDATVSSVEVDGGRVAAVTTDGATGRVRRPARHVLSTIPLTYLARAMRPMPPDDVLTAADALQYRAMILVYLVLDAEQFSEYDAHYFPDANLTITRLSEPKNYSLAAAAGTTVLCAELPCTPDDATWSLTNEQLTDLVRNDLAAVGLPIEAPIRRVVSRRLRQAYPIYTADYRRHFDRIDAWVGTIEGVTTLGRQGLFAHDNTHHTLAMAYAAGDCLAADGRFDRSRWQEHRRHFESHVVED